MAAIRWSKVRYFKKDEFSEPDKLEESLVYRLDVARGLAEKLALRAGLDYIPRIYITSDYRAGDGEHGSGEGLDISDNLSGFNVASRWRYFVLPALYLAGFKRVGDYDRHLHIGTSLDEDQYVCWWGKSQ